MHLQIASSLWAVTAMVATANVVPSLWDGQCYYPTADSAFTLDSYLGRWYQVAGTVAPYTAGCKCIYAQYAANEDGTVQVNNTCEIDGTVSNILGTASPANASYGVNGVFRVQFPGVPDPECPGANYIVQDYANDVAIVQASNFSTLFILSREQNLNESVLEAWIERAGLLGSDLSEVEITDQSDCQFT